MQRSLYFAPLALLFLAFIVPSQAINESEIPEQWRDAEVVWYEVGPEVKLECGAAVNGSRQWSKNGTSLAALGLGERVRVEGETARLVLGVRSHEDDWGLWTCGARRVLLRGHTRAKLPVNTNVVEGQKLRLVCRLTGKPYPSVTWLFTNSSDPEDINGTDVTVVLGSRAVLTSSEQGVAGAALELTAAARSDAGRYVCRAGAGTVHIGTGDAAPHVAVTTLRVKDMYAALWPFLGICAEVLVLCAIILVYEKRRTKPEMDDSDTDNHDQKKS